MPEKIFRFYKATHFDNSMVTETGRTCAEEQIAFEYRDADYTHREAIREKLLGILNQILSLCHGDTVLKMFEGQDDWRIQIV